MASNNQKKPEFSARSADPNVMTSTDFSFVRKHWYVGIKVLALYAIFAILTSSFSVPLWVNWTVSIILLILWVYFDYTDIYKLAMRDYNVVKYGYIEYDPKRGLKTGLLAQIPVRAAHVCAVSWLRHMVGSVFCAVAGVLFSLCVLRWGHEDGHQHLRLGLYSLLSDPHAVPACDRVSGLQKRLQQQGHLL